jgi:hypothetical protein
VPVLCRIQTKVALHLIDGGEGVEIGPLGCNVVYVPMFQRDRWRWRQYVLPKHRYLPTSHKTIPHRRWKMVSRIFLADLYFEVRVMKLEVRNVNCNFTENRLTLHRSRRLLITVPGSHRLNYSRPFVGRDYVLIWASDNNNRNITNEHICTIQNRVWCLLALRSGASKFSAGKLQGGTYSTIAATIRQFSAVFITQVTKALI